MFAGRRERAADICLCRSAAGHRRSTETATAVAVLFTHSQVQIGSLFLLWAILVAYPTKDREREPEIIKEVRTQARYNTCCRSSPPRSARLLSISVGAKRYDQIVCADIWRAVGIRGFQKRSHAHAPQWILVAARESCMHICRNMTWSVSWEKERERGANQR